MKKLFILSAIISTFLFTNCATILNGTDQEVFVNSSPKGAKIIYNGFDVGTTPKLIRMPKEKQNFVEFQLEGYQSKTVLVQRTTGGGFVVLDILFGLLPLIVDATNGAWFFLDESAFCSFDGKPNDYNPQLDNPDIMRKEPLKTPNKK